MKKINKLGFFLVETVVVIAIVGIVITLLFKSFSSLYTRFASVEYYNTVSSTNAAGQVKQYIDNSNLDYSDILDGAAYKNLSSSSVFVNAYFTALKERLGITHVYLIDMPLFFADSNNLNHFNINAREYLNTLESDTSQYRIFVIDSKNGYGSISTYNYYLTLTGDPLTEYLTYVDLNGTFNEPGYIAKDLNGNNLTVSITGNVNTSVAGTYYYTYNLGALTLRRKVVVLEKEYTFDYTGDYQKFTVPVSGDYKVELWGAGVTNGNGAYTSGTTYLKKGETFYVYVGESKRIFTPLAGLTSVEVLVVAGGGGGCSGGGGAGGLIYNAAYAVSATNYAVTVGNGGNGGASLGGAGKTNGENSVFGTLTAIGGGAGGSNDSVSANAGGSGGGGGATSTIQTPGGAGTAGQGNSGGTVTSTYFGSPYPSAGGGGAGAVGNPPFNTTTSGNGGVGLSYNISGIPTYYAGGGGSGTWSGGTAGIGGLGGGGKGIVGYNGYSGLTNTGGGGGGGGSAGVGGKGGSGIVIISYPGTRKADGGTVSYANGKTIHTFIYNNTAFNGSTADSGGWNGGGATDIRLESGNWNNNTSLISRIMVAGGAGAGNVGGAHGGALTGLYPGVATGGTQTAGGTTQSGSYASSSFGIGGGGCSGGGGYYGGGGATCSSGGAGGSSFISGFTGVNAVNRSGVATGQVIHYSGYKFNTMSMIAGNAAMPNFNGIGTKVGNTGNGYAKISLIDSAATSSLEKVRYIFNQVNANSVNAGAHWVEIQALTSNGTNVALGRPVTASYNPGGASWPLVTDGNTNTAGWVDGSTGVSNVIIDLGQEYDLSSIKIWHYYGDGRTYLANETKVAGNDQIYTTVDNLTYPETPEGRTIRPQ